MINTKELCRLAQAVQGSPRNIHERVNAIHNLHDALPSGVVLEILDRLEAAESDALEQARLNGMGASREAALMAKLEAVEEERIIDEQRIADLMVELNRVGHENEALHAQIEEMKKQEPVAWFVAPSSRPFWGEYARQDAELEAQRCGGTAKAEPLYALPGAKGE